MVAKEVQVLQETKVYQGSQVLKDNLAWPLQVPEDLKGILGCQEIRDSEDLLEYLAWMVCLVPL
jgi:hypothetical protein